MRNDNGGPRAREGSTVAVTMALSWQKILKTHIVFQVFYLRF